jgi:hypothetical protein
MRLFVLLPIHCNENYYSGFNELAAVSVNHSFDEQGQTINKKPCLTHV